MTPDFYGKAKDLEILAKSHGLMLRPIEWHFEDAETIYEMGAYGMPGRFSHWSHGRDYWRMKSSYDRGAGRIYEMVINTSPVHAFMLENNSDTANLLVAAHVLGHVDCFERNTHLNKVRKDAVQMFNADAEMVDSYRDQYGADRVEWLLDRALAIESLVADEPEVAFEVPEAKEVNDPYADLFEPVQRKKYQKITEWLLGVATTDVLGVIARHGRLEMWERSVLEIVRRESLYFAPQRVTKILNEGWATYWERKLLIEFGLSGAQWVEASKDHAGIVYAGSSFNPYQLGLALIEHIVEKYDEDEAKRMISLSTDDGMLRNYVDEEFIKDQGYFAIFAEDNPQERRWIHEDLPWEKVRDRLIDGITRHRLSVEVAQARENGDLYLKQTGFDLDPEYAQKTLQYVADLWGGIARLHTKLDGGIKIYEKTGGERK